MTITYPLLVYALIAGLLMGGFYAALSAGATVASGLLDIVNIAHPTFAVIGAYAVLVLNRTFNIDPILCGLLLTPVFYGAGMLLYQVYHHFFERRGNDAMRGLAFFFGLMFIAEVALIMLFGVDFRYVHAHHDLEFRRHRIAVATGGPVRRLGSDAGRARIVSEKDLYRTSHRRGGARSIRASAGGGVAGPHQADRFRHRLRQRGTRRRVYHCHPAAAACRRPRVHRARFRDLRFRRPWQPAGHHR